MVELIFIFFLFHFLVNQIQYLIDRKVVFYLFGFVLSGVVIYYISQITYTADYSMYESFYKWEFDETDPLFYYSALFFKQNDYGFQNLFSAHMIVISLLYLFFVLKFNKNLFYVFGLYIIILFIPYVNQIRYFIAFPCFLLACYYLLFNRNWFLFVLFAVLGILSHSAIVVLYTFFPFFIFVKDKYHTNFFILGSLISLIASYLISSSSLHLLLEHFGEYIKNENQSSVLGGIFNTLPILTLIIPLYFIDKNYEGDKEDPTYLFLKKLSFYTIALLPASIFVQVIGYRYILPFAVVWLIFFLYLIKDKSLFIQTRYYFVSYILVIMVVYLQYELSMVVFGESVLMRELVDTINSIENY